MRTLVSTKHLAFMQLVAGRRARIAEIKSFSQVRQRSPFCFLIAVALPNRSFQLLCQQSANRSVLLRRQNPGLSNKVAVQLQSNVGFHSTFPRVARLYVLHVLTANNVLHPRDRTPA